LWEFSCGAGSDAHAEGWPPGEIRPEHRFLRVRGGYLYGTTKTGENGNILLTLQHCDVDGNVVHEEVFNANDQNNSK
jgi:alkaline phosphatase D